MAKDKKPSSGKGAGVAAGIAAGAAFAALAPFTAGLSLLLGASLGTGVGLLAKEACDERPETWNFEITEIDGKPVK